MKRIIVFLLSLLVLLSNFVGCKNDSFVDVASVTYTVEGKKTTESSYAYMSLGSRTVISEEEYMNADSKFKFDSLVNLTQKLMPSYKTVSSILGLDNSDKNKYIYEKFIAWGSPGLGQVRGEDWDYGFVKQQICSEISYNYIKVKVVDDDTIVVKNSSGETTYNVSSYSITYFDN